MKTEGEDRSNFSSPSADNHCHGFNLPLQPPQTGTNGFHPPRLAVFAFARGKGTHMSLEVGSAFPKILVWRDHLVPNRALDKHDKRRLKSSKFSLSNPFPLSPATLHNGPLPDPRR